MTCHRTLILHQGRILAHDTQDNLQQVMSDGGQIIAEIVAPEDELRACWEEAAEVEHFDLSASEGDYIRCTLTPRPGVDLRPQIFSLICERGWKLRELTRSRHSLEDIFVRVTRAEKEEEL